jgi:T5SS/PEP-CTERM-associated repeat protein
MILSVGGSSAGNRAEVSEGGRLACTDGSIGVSFGANSNTVLLTGSGSRWNNAGNLIVGNGGNGNVLLASNGATVLSSNATIGVNGSTANNNLAIITGAGTIWNNTRHLVVGESGVGNRLQVDNGATVLSDGLFIGLNSLSANNRVAVNGGTLRVTNAAGTGVLDIRRGTNVINGGLVEVDQLLATNVSVGRWVFNGGTLAVGRLAIATGGITIGDGVSPATLHLTGNGTHSLATTPGILANASLTGSGTITVGIQFVLGSTLSPGTGPGGIGRLTAMGAAFFAGTAMMDIGKSGAALTNDQFQVANQLEFLGAVTVNHLGPDALAAGDRFQLFPAGSYAGSFASLTLPPLGPGLRWATNLLVDGSIEVESLAPSVTTLPASGLGETNATLNGAANPKGLPTTGWFEWGLTTNYGNVTAPQPLGSGGGFTNFSALLDGLVIGVPYHFRAAASNSFGVSFGADQTFVLAAYLTNVAWYRLGENDPGAGLGVNVTNTIDIIGAHHLRVSGLSAYTSVPIASPQSRVGSTLAVVFANGSLSNVIVFTAREHFALELWARPSTTASGTDVIAYNGDTGLNGWGIIQASNRFMGLLGGVGTVGLGSASPNVWTHLALVRDNGVTTFYSNGVAAGNTASAPNLPAGNFAIGGRPQAPPSDFFVNGAVDEVRVSTFRPGQFRTNDLLFYVQRVATLPATDLELTAATLNGVANPLALPGLVWFEWGPATNFSTLTVPRAINPGVDNVPFNETLAGLNVGTLYSFRAATSNRLGVVRGSNQFFRTLGPGVTTLPASPVLGDVAGLNGAANPNGNSTTAWFEWGATTNYGNVTFPQAIGSGTSSVNFNEILSDLTGGVYHFRAVASNGIGVALGTNQSFTIGPTVSTQPAGPILGDVAGLNGAANPRGASTRAWFEWGTTTNYGNVTPPQPIGSGTNNVNFSQFLSDLTAGTYEFRAVASNSLGTVFGNNRTFSVGPTVSTLAASPIVGTTAGLNGSANPRGGAAVGWFEWGATTNFGSVTSPQALGSGTNNVNFNELLSALPGGTYQFRAVVSNSLAVVSGSTRSFVIGPAVQTLPATPLSVSTATLNGLANPQGSNTTAWFEWGTTTNYGNVTAPQVIGSGTNGVSFSETISGLTATDTYHFRAVASNSLAVLLGIDRNFRTLDAYLKASNTGVIDQFGFAIAMSGNTIVVGAPGEDSNATGVNGNETNNSALGSGAAYVFVRTGDSWAQQAYLKASNTEASDQFGISVAVSGDTIVVGAQGEDSDATGVNGDQGDNSAISAGAVYVFVRSGTNWTQQRISKPITPERETCSASPWQRRATPSSSARAWRTAAPPESTAAVPTIPRPTPGRLMCSCAAAQTGRNRRISKRATPERTISLASRLACPTTPSSWAPTLRTAMPTASTARAATTGRSAPARPMSSCAAGRTGSSGVT